MVTSITNLDGGSENHVPGEINEESTLHFKWAQFYENTTAHGIPHVTRAKGNILLASFVFCPRADRWGGPPNLKEERAKNNVCS